MKKTNKKIPKYTVGGGIIPTASILGLQQMYEDYQNNQPGIPPAADKGIFNPDPRTDYSQAGFLPRINERTTDPLAGRSVTQGTYQPPSNSTGQNVMAALGKIAPALSAAAPWAGAAVAGAGLAYKGLQALDRGPQSQYGMMAENNLYNIQGYNKGGAIGDQQLSSDSVKIQGNPNQIDGNYRQVEGSEGMFNHNEVVSKLPDGTNFAFSTKYTNPLTGNSISKDAEENRKRAGKLEQKLIDNPKDAETSRLAAMLDKELTELAQLNEVFKKEEQQQAQMRQNPQMMQGMQQDPMQYLNGGEIPRFEDGGGIGSPTPEELKRIVSLYKTANSTREDDDYRKYIAYASQVFGSPAAAENLHFQIRDAETEWVSAGKELDSDDFWNFMGDYIGEVSPSILEEESKRQAAQSQSLLRQEEDYTPGPGRFDKAPASLQRKEEAIRTAKEKPLTPYQQQQRYRLEENRRQNYKKAQTLNFNLSAATITLETQLRDLDNSPVYNQAVDQILKEKEAKATQKQLVDPAYISKINEEAKQEAEDLLKESLSFFQGREKVVKDYITKGVSDKDIGALVSNPSRQGFPGLNRALDITMPALGIDRDQFFGGQQRTDQLATQGSTTVGATDPANNLNLGQTPLIDISEEEFNARRTQQGTTTGTGQTGGGQGTGGSRRTGGSGTSRPAAKPLPTTLTHAGTGREYSAQEFQNWLLNQTALTDAQKQEMLGESGADGKVGPKTQAAWNEVGGRYAHSVNPMETLESLETLPTPTSVTSQTAKTPEQMLQKGYETTSPAEEVTGGRNWKSRIGDVLQGINVLGSFSGLARGPEKEKLPRAANFQVSEIPQMNQARNAYNAATRGAQAGNYNTNRYMMQGMNANYMNQLSQIGQQTQQTNLGLAAQTNQANTQIAAQQSDINARNRGAYDQAKQAAFATVGNVGRGLNDVKANKEAMAMMINSFRDVYDFWKKDHAEIMAQQGGQSSIK